MLGCEPQLVRHRQRLFREACARFGEWIHPEGLVEGAAEALACQQRMCPREVGERLAERGVLVAVERPIILGLKRFDRRLPRLPRTRCAEHQGRPGHRK